MIRASAKFDVTFGSKQTASHTHGFREACDRSTIREAALDFTRRVVGFLVLSTTEKGLLAKPCRSFWYLFVWLKVGPTWSLLSKDPGSGPNQGNLNPPVALFCTYCNIQSAIVVLKKYTVCT